MRFPWPLASPYPKDDEGLYPSRESCDKIAWPDYHFSVDISSAVGNLYDNYNGLRDKFANFWGKVAKEFGNSTKLLGYELINEPWCGNIYENPLLLIPGVADKEKLQPMYDQINAEIRKNDPERLIFFESVTWEVAGIGEEIGFTHPPGGPEFAHKSVLSFHNSVLPDTFKEPYYYDKKMKEIERLNITGMVTETNEAENAIKFELADKYGIGWMHWSYKLYSSWTGDSEGLFDSNCQSD